MAAERLFQQGEHVCVLYETADEQLAVAAAFVAEGLRCGEQCMYVAGGATDLERFRAALRTGAIDPAAAESARALLMLTSAEAHLEGGFFDAERMLSMLNAAIESALNDGFMGLRTCGDMSWLLASPGGASQVVEYEALLNPLFDKVRALGMCQYDRGRLPAELVDHAIATHSSFAMHGGRSENPFYCPPSIAPTRAPEPDDVERKVRELRRRARN